MGKEKDDFKKIMGKFVDSYCLVNALINDYAELAARLQDLNPDQVHDRIRTRAQALKNKFHDDIR